MKALVGATVQNSGERSGCLDVAGLLLGCQHKLVYSSFIAAAQSSNSGVISVIEWILLKWGDGRNAGGATLQHSTGR